MCAKAVNRVAPRLPPPLSPVCVCVLREEPQVGAYSFEDQARHTSSRPFLFFFLFILFSLFFFLCGCWRHSGFRRLLGLACFRFIQPCWPSFWSSSSSSSCLLVSFSFGLSIQNANDMEINSDRDKLKDPVPDPTILTVYNTLWNFLFIPFSTLVNEKKLLKRFACDRHTTTTTTTTFSVVVIVVVADIALFRFVSSRLPSLFLLLVWYRLIMRHSSPSSSSSSSMMTTITFIFRNREEGRQRNCVCL